MKINWYPGHMTKAMRMMDEQASLVDCFLCVLDSRAPRASINSQFLQITGEKPVLYVLNKSDMVEKPDLDKWIAFLKNEGLEFVVTDSTSSKGRAEIIKKIQKVNSKKLERFKQKGINRAVRAMVAGVPNSGKSTLINNLAGSKKTSTGDKAGVTRGKQWIKVADSVELLDTPGTLPPDLDDQAAAMHLAMIGSINDDILSMEEVAKAIAEHFLQWNKQAFCGRYNIKDIVIDDYVFLDDIAKSRGFLMKGNVTDFERSAKAVVDDFRKQRIAKIMLEFPEEGF